jgi:hypothetical protein
MLHRRSHLRASTRSRSFIFRLPRFAAVRRQSIVAILVTQLSIAITMPACSAFPSNQRQQQPDADGLGEHTNSAQREPRLARCFKPAPQTLWLGPVKQPVHLSTWGEVVLKPSAINHSSPWFAAWHAAQTRQHTGADTRTQCRTE